VKRYDEDSDAAEMAGAEDQWRMDSPIHAKLVVCYQISRCRNEFNVKDVRMLIDLTLDDQKCGWTFSIQPAPACKMRVPPTLKTVKTVQQSGRAT